MHSLGPPGGVPATCLQLALEESNWTAKHRYNNWEKGQKKEHKKDIYAEEAKPNPLSPPLQNYRFPLSPLVVEK